MKFIISISFLVLISLFSMVFAQNETIVLNLNATEFNGKVLLTWAVTQGNTCNGITVLHGVDSVNFSQIGTIEGICGSNAETINYQFTDVIPSVNETNYYRLSLAGIGYSYIVLVDVYDAGNQSYIVTPNPISSESQLIFDNGNQEKVTITFFNEVGAIITKVTTTEQSITIEREAFKQGVYFFVLKFDGIIKFISGKFSVI